MQTVVVKHNSTFTSIPEKDFNSTYKTTDCYVPICTYKDLSSRSKDNVEKIGYFFHDIDVGDKYKFKSVTDALTFVQDFVKRYMLPTPRIISSGGGLHILFPLQRALSLKPWRELAAKRRDVLTFLGLGGAGFDNAKTIDPCAMYRVEGSVNTKYSPPVIVTQLQDEGPAWGRTEWEDFIKLHAPALTPSSKPHTPTSSSLKADADKIADECPQLGEFKNSLGKISEPLWHTSMGILAHCNKGKQFAHLWSAGHPSYDASETDKKFDVWVDKGYPPPKCNKFEEANPGGCSSCPHHNKIESPISLGLDSTIGVDPDIIPPGFTVTLDGIYYQGQPISSTPFYLKGLHENEQGDMIYEVNIYRHSKWVTKVFDSSLFSDARAFRSQLGKQILIPIDNKVTRLYMGYLLSFAEAVQRKQNESRAKPSIAVSRMGWVGTEKQFALGDRIYAPKTDPITYPQTHGDNQAIKSLTTKGSAYQWRKGMVSLSASPNPESQVLWFTVLAGIFAPPLLRYTNLQGAAIHIYGTTGTGKSLALKAITSAYGDPEHLIGQASDTPLSTSHRLAFLNSLPYTIDEVTSMSKRGLTQLIFDITSGRSRLRLTNKAEVRKTLEIRSVLVTSSNVSLVNHLNTGESADEAVRARLFELDTSTIRRPTPRDARKMLRSIHNNYGTIGAAYIQAVVDTKNIAKKYKSIAEDLQREYSFESTERFIVNLFAATKLGIDIAARAKLVNRTRANAALTQAIDYYLRRGVFEYLKETDDTVDYRTQPFDAILDFLQEHQAYTLTITSQIGGRANEFSEPRSGITKVLINSYKKELLISRKAFNKYCQDKNLDPRGIVDSLVRQKYMLLSKAKYRLSLPQRPGYAIWCLAFTAKHCPELTKLIQW